MSNLTTSSFPSLLPSTGIRGKIQISQSTADILTASGKGHWVKPREDKVEAKGKGMLTTFWLNPVTRRGSSTTSSETGSIGRAAPMALLATTMEKKDRLVDWMVELLIDHIKKIVSLPLPAGYPRVSRTRSNRRTSHLLSFAYFYRWRGAVP
jgi:hypothetical protein